MKPDDLDDLMFRLLGGTAKLAALVIVIVTLSSAYNESQKRELYRECMRAMEARLKIDPKSSTLWCRL